MSIEPRKSILNDLLNLIGIKIEINENNGEKQDVIDEPRASKNFISSIRDFYLWSQTDDNSSKSSDYLAGTHLIQAGYYVVYNLISCTLYFIISSGIKNYNSLHNLSILFFIIGLTLVLGFAYHLIKAGVKINKYLENTKGSSLNEHNS
jgi:hypothetical protein